MLEADSAESALQLLAGTQRQIDVFVTDVVMPGMDGPSWVRSALRDRPATRVVFISGYTEDIFEDGRSPVQNSIFVQKPFTLAALCDAVATQYAERGLRQSPSAPTAQAVPADFGLPAY
ncbi:response regulator [Paracoccus suum]|uniref:response regulator n=1 Tax=Paracoccus suum TaxID=2259340 RepID=UPI003BAED788